MGEGEIRDPAVQCLDRRGEVGGGVAALVDFQRHAHFGTSPLLRAPVGGGGGGERDPRRGGGGGRVLGNGMEGLGQVRVGSQPVEQRGAQQQFHVSSPSTGPGRDRATARADRASRGAGP